MTQYGMLGNLFTRNPLCNNSHHCSERIKKTFNANKFVKIIDISTAHDKQECGLKQKGPVVINEVMYNMHLYREIEDLLFNLKFDIAFDNFTDSSENTYYIEQKKYLLYFITQEAIKEYIVQLHPYESFIAKLNNGKVDDDNNIYLVKMDDSHRILVPEPVKTLSTIDKNKHYLNTFQRLIDKKLVDLD